MAPANPVTPVSNGFLSRFIGADWLELREGDGDLSFVPAYLYEHVMFASVFGSHSNDCDGFAFSQGRARVRACTFCREREADAAFEVVLPAHRLLFRAGVDNGLGRWKA